MSRITTPREIPIMISDIDPVADEGDQMQLARSPVTDPPLRAAPRRARSPSPPGAARYPTRDDRLGMDGGRDTQSAGTPGTMTNFEYTFRLMTVRRLERELMGTITKPHKGRQLLWILAFVALEVGLASITLQEGIALKIDFSVNLLSNLLGLLLLSVFLYLGLQSGVSVIRWCLFWVAAGSIVTLIITPSNNLDILGLHDFTAGGVSAIIASVVIAICTLHIALWLAYNKVYPHAIRMRWPCVSNLNYIFQIRPTARPGHYHYRIPLPFPFWLPCCGQDRTFGYQGEVDEEGRPHGLGTWTDDARHGECLQGVWQHGRPIGPFRGSEYHSDYRFVNVRMAFAHNRADHASPVSWWRPTWSTEGLHWGVASLEQSVAGAWFKALPHPEIISSEAGRDARWCLEQLIALRPDTQAPSITVTAADGELVVENHQIAPGGDPSKVTIQLVPAGTSYGSAPPSRSGSSSNVAAAEGTNGPYSGGGNGVSGGGNGVSGGSPTVPTCTTPSNGPANGPTSSGAAANGLPTGAECMPPSASSGRASKGAGSGDGGVFFTPVPDGSASRAMGSGATPGGPLSLGLGHGLGHAHGHGWSETVGQCSYRPNTFSSYREQAEGEEGDEENQNQQLRDACASGGGSPASGGSGGARPGGSWRWQVMNGLNGRRSENTDYSGMDGVPLLPTARSQLPNTVLRVMDRMPYEKAPPEVLIYMPGFNAAIPDGVKVCGQLLCLADFPPNLKAFMFSWPGGRGLTYYTAINFSKHERNQADFAKFFASIIDAGVREIHILCHSVGAQVLFAALHLIAPMLQTCDQQAQQRHAAFGGGPPTDETIPKARLATCLILSPDYPLKRFIRHDFNALRKLCSCITLYCDTADRALTYSEIFNREKALGKNPFDLVRAERSGEEDTERAAPSRAGRPAPTRDATAPSAWEMRGVLSWVASLGEYMGESVPAMFRQSSALEVDLSSRLRHKGAPLDMDVIDTSWMDSNVQELRHNYFNVNRYMIDDIREVISMKRRAHLRTGRLTHRRGNVWSFLAAPKYIVNA